MMKHIITKTIAILILSFPGVISCTHSDYDTRHIFTSQTGNHVTIWDDYIIFEKYEEKDYPNENYIKLYHDTRYKGCLHVFFKKDNTIIVLRQSNDSIALGFNPQKYNIEILNGWENWPHYYDLCSMDDTLAVADYYFHEWRGALWPTFFEIIGDSVYVTNYHDKGHFLFRIAIKGDTVVSRYDKIIDKRDPY